MNNLPSEILIELSKNIDNSNWHNEKWSEIISRIKELTAYISIGRDFIDGKSCFTELSIESMKLQYLCMSYPLNDDRALFNNKNLKIGLDIDEVICNFIGGYNKKFNIENNPSFWNYSYDIVSNLNELKNNKEFWVNLPKLRNIEFEPTLYCTSRSIPVEWTMEWLEKNGFPCKPVITVPFGESKLEVLKQAGIQVFIDDKIETFLELNSNGVFTYLMDCPMNKHFDAGYKRIYNLDKFKTWQ